MASSSQALTVAEEPTPVRDLFSYKFKRLFSIYLGEQDGDFVTERENNINVSYPRGITFFLLLLSGALPYVVVVLDDTVVATILPILVSEFRRPGDIGWYASSYFLPLTVLMPLYGKCYALWKVKPLFLISLAILTVGSIVTAAAKTSAMFIAGRTVAGAGAGGIITGAMRIITLAAPREKRTFLEAAGAVVMGVSTMAGPILGGFIADAIGWEWSFWINAPIAFVSAIIVSTVFPKQTSVTPLFDLSNLEKIKRLDPIGAFSLIAGLACLISALQSITISTNFNISTILLFASAAFLLLVFVLHEAFISAPFSLMPRKLLALRTVWSCCLGLFFLFAGFINYIFFLSIYFQAVQGQSAESSAIRLLPYVLSVSVAATLTGIAVSTVRYYNPFFILGGACLATGAGMIITFDMDSPARTWIGYEALLGAGVGFTILANVVPGQTVLAEEYHSIVQGLTFLCSLLGASISLPVSSTIFNKLLINRVESLQIPLLVKATVLSDPTKVRFTVDVAYQPIVLHALLDSIRDTFLFGLGCSILCAVSLFFVPWKPLITPKSQEKSTIGDRPPRLPLVEVQSNSDSWERFLESTLSMTALTGSPMPSRSSACRSKETMFVRLPVETDVQGHEFCNPCN